MKKEELTALKAITDIKELDAKLKEKKRAKRQSKIATAKTTMLSILFFITSYILLLYIYKYNYFI